MTQWTLRQWCAFAVGLISAAAGVVYLIVQFGDWGVWRSLMDHRMGEAMWAEGGVVVIAVGAHGALLTGRCRRSVVVAVDLLVVAVSLLYALIFRSLEASILVGAIVGASVVATWTSAWVMSRRDRAHATSRREALSSGLVEFGQGLLAPLAHVARGPAGPTGPSESGQISPAVSQAGGWVALLLIWSLMSSCTAFGAFRVSDAGHRPIRTRDHPPSDTPERTGAGTTTTTGSEPNAGTGGALHCDKVGAGPGHPAELDEVLAASIPSYRPGTRLCGVGFMVWDPAALAFVQAIFTEDGSDGRLVGWNDGVGWVVALIPPDSGAAYKRIDAALDFGVLGRPHDYVRCGTSELWIQTFVVSDGRISGVGMRIGEDTDGEANQPLFVWGATIELALSSPAAGNVLPMPSGDPQPVDGDGVSQWFGSVKISSAAGPAETLSREDLLTACLSMH